jgi:hypothetical protein
MRRLTTHDSGVLALLFRSIIGLSNSKRRSSFIEKKNQETFALGSGGFFDVPCKDYKSLLRSFSSEKRPLVRLHL